MRVAGLVLSLLILAQSSLAQDRPPRGSTRAVQVARVAEAPVIDGRLDDPAWREAEVARDFWISEFQRAPREQTEVWVAADDSTLYFAFVCYDTRPDEIRASQIRRDSNLWPDDHVTIQLDPYHNHRLISEFSVNADGTQSDAMAGGRARNIGWKGDWQAAVQRTAWGWTAEIAIPFAILNYAPGASVFGVNFVRYHHRTEELSRWADVTPQYLPEEAGHLVGLVLPGVTANRRITFMPYGAIGMNAPDRSGTMRETLAAAGFDFRYDLASNLATVLSVQPDFSQVEEEIFGLEFDYNEKFRTDRRPFFQEGGQFFGGRTYFHAGRVPDFDVGVKTFGRLGPMQLGLLGVQGDYRRRDYVARLAGELGASVGAGLMVVGTDRPAFENHLVAINAGGRLKPRLVFGADMATTFTRGRRGEGQRLAFDIGYQSASWNTGVAVDRVDEDFFPANGFIADDLLGTRGGSTFLGYARELGTGPFRRLEASASYARRVTRTGSLQREHISLYGSGELRPGIYFSIGTTQGPYRPRMGMDQWAGRLNDDRFHTASLYFNTRSTTFGYGITYSWGDLGGGTYSNLVPSLWVKLLRRIHMGYSYQVAESFGRDTQHVLTASWEVGAQQAISARWVRLDADYYRVAFSRRVRRGVDIGAVFNNEPWGPNRLVAKVVWSIGN